jgi:hypothetical protein
MRYLPFVKKLEKSDFLKIYKVNDYFDKKNVYVTFYREIYMKM